MWSNEPYFEIINFDLVPPQYGGPKGPTQTKKENTNKKEHITKQKQKQKPQIKKNTSTKRKKKENANKKEHIT